MLVSPLTGGASQINIYGAVNGASVFRPNALTGDPNHLGIMLIVPLLVLTPLYLRLEPRPPPRRRLALLIGFLLLVEVATLSRSGLLGLGVGALVLALPYRGYLRSRALLAPLLGVLAVLARRRRHAASTSSSRPDPLPPRDRAATRSRRTSRSTASSRRFCTRTRCFGLGLNNFSVYYQFVTGKTNWGPHSFYVSLIVETGHRRHAALRVVPLLGLRAAAPRAHSAAR